MPRWRAAVKVVSHFSNHSLQEALLAGTANFHSGKFPVATVALLAS